MKKSEKNTGLITRLRAWYAKRNEHSKCLKMLKNEYQEKVNMNQIMLASDIKKELEEKKIFLPDSDIQKIYESLRSLSNRRLSSIENSIRTESLSNHGAGRIAQKKMYPDFEKLFKQNYLSYTKDWKKC